MATEFCLNNQTSGKDTMLGALLREMRTVKNQPVFRTWVYAHDGNLKAILCTTNEKVHLALGKLTDSVLRRLAKLFEAETQLDDQLIFSFEPEEGQVSPRNWFVTASRDGQERIFHIAPGH